jgi:hypothetical protein
MPTTRDDGAAAARADESLAQKEMTPEDGDFVVREEVREGSIVYVLHIPPAADRFDCRTREDGIFEALVGGERQRVRVWCTDAADNAVLVEDFRARAAPTDP